MIEVDDVAPLLEEVSSFARGRVATEAARPEHPMSPQTVSALTDEALALGLLPAAQAPGGVGLWENLDSGHEMAFNIGLLRHVARADVGLAFAWHRQALAHRLAHDADQPLPQGSYCHLVGHHGLARTALARWLTTQDLNKEETALLVDWLDRRTHATPVVLPQDWQTLVWPVWRQGSLHWQALARAQATISLCAPQHGLDELRLWRVSDAGPGGETWAAGPASMARLLTLEMVGLLAIAEGGLARGEEQVRDYVAIRRQGGKLIGSHPAVHQMVSEIRAIRQGAEVALAACERPITDIDLGLLAGLRASQHTALCHAANQAVQVHGGIGYMRDLGMEKLVRDLNMLRLQAGGVRELPAFVTGWNGGRE